MGVMGAGETSKYQRAAQIGVGVKWGGAKKSQKAKGKAQGHDVKSLKGSFKEKAIHDIFAAKCDFTRVSKKSVEGAKILGATLVGTKKIKGLKRAFKLFKAKISGKKAKLTKLTMQDAQGKQFSVKIDKKTAANIEKHEGTVRGTVEARGSYIKGQLKVVLEEHRPALDGIFEKLKKNTSKSELGKLKKSLQSIQDSLEKELTDKWNELTPEANLKGDTLDVLCEFRDEVLGEASNDVGTLLREINNKINYS